MIVWLDNDSLILSPEMTGIQLDVEELVEAAYAYGRTGSNMEKRIARLRAEDKIHAIALLPYLRLNLAAIRSNVQSFCDGYSVEMVEPVVSISGQRPTYKLNGNNDNAVHQVLTITMGTPESYLDPNDLYYEILDAYSMFTMEFRYEPPVLVAPKVPNAQEIFDTYCISPVDAILDPKTYAVTDEVYGYGFNVHMLQQRLDRADYGETLEVTLEFLLPDITAEALAGGLFEDRLARYTATCADTTANRNKNLTKACNTLNGLVVKPGESFDLNGALGPRTSERGYYSAPIYAGSTASVIGGGVAQIASALYYCALQAGMQIDEHHYHRYAMTYTPMGTDAALSNTENLVFTNTSSDPIRILAEAIGGNVKITLMGTQEGKYVFDIESVIILEKQPGIVYQSMEKDNVYGYTDGTVIQTGLVGYDVETYLCTYNKKTGELVSRELLAAVSYDVRDIVMIKIETME